MGTGFAFNCDGGNAPIFAAGPGERHARVIRKVVNAEYLAVTPATIPSSHIASYGRWRQVRKPPSPGPIISWNGIPAISSLAKEKNGGEVHIYPAQLLPTV